MSSSRSRNKLCLSLDNGSNDLSGSTTHLNRWSEVVPPKTALTFAALWDPQDGMVTFSGASLLEADGSSDSSPQLGVLDDDDYDLTQFITTERDATGANSTANDNTGTLATFQDAFKAFFHRTPWDSREHLHATIKSGSCSGRATPRGYGLHTRASSTLDGLDIYSHDVQLKPKKSLQLSCIDLLDIESSFRTPPAFGKLRLRSDLMLDAHHMELEGGSVSLGDRPPCLRSRFSTTTASSSDYIDIPPSSLQAKRIFEPSVVAAPKWTSSRDPAGSWPFLPRRRRLLRKPRPPSGDDAHTAAAISALPPRTPRKVSASQSASSLSPSTTVCSSSSPQGASLLPAMTTKERRRRLRRIGSSGGPVSPKAAKAVMSTPTVTLLSKSMATSTATGVPSVTLSNSKAPGVKLFRFTFSLPRWRTSPHTSRRRRRWASLYSDPDSDSEGWVCIDITPAIRQRYVANLDDDDEHGYRTEL